MAVVHDEVVQLVVGDVVEGALLGGEHEAGVGAEPPQYTPPLGLPRIWVCTLLGSAAGPVVAPHALLQVAEHRLAGGRQGGLLYPFTQKWALLLPDEALPNLEAGGEDVPGR